MQKFLKQILKKAKSDPQRIVFPEGTEPRVLKAVSKILKLKIAKPILLGDEKAIAKAAKKLKVNIKNAQIVNPATFPRFKEYCDKFFKLRKHKGITPQQATQTMKDLEYLGTMMVYMDDADGLVSGSTHSTADTVRPALQIIKTHSKFHKVSGVFLMMLDNKLLLFADAAIEIQPEPRDLADIAIDSANNAKRFGLKPRVAMLSFSTKGSANHPLVQKVRDAVKIIKRRKPNLPVDGEMQVDAALVPKVAKLKNRGGKIQGNANVLIFPDLGAANIAYKLVERLGGATAVGPILQGLKKPVNDLSRGCSADDIVDVTAITVIEAQHNW